MGYHKIWYLYNWRSESIAHIASHEYEELQLIFLENELQGHVIGKEPSNQSSNFKCIRNFATDEVFGKLNSQDLQFCEMEVMDCGQGGAMMDFREVEF